jgi:hypothetical protein
MYIGKFHDSLFTAILRECHFVFENVIYIKLPMNFIYETCQLSQKRWLQSNPLQFTHVLVYAGPVQSSADNMRVLLLFIITVLRITNIMAWPYIVAPSNIQREVQM